MYNRRDLWNLLNLIYKITFKDFYIVLLIYQNFLTISYDTIYRGQ